MALSVETAKQQLARAEQALARIRAEYDAALASFNQERTAANAQRGTAEYLALRQKYNLASLEAQIETVTADVREAQQEVTSAEAAAQAEANAQQNTVKRSEAAVSGSDSAGQIAREDGNTAEVIRPDGRVTPAAVNPSGSNATVPVTKDNEVKDQNTDPPIRTVEETQAVTSVSSQSFPISVGEENAPQTVFSSGAAAGKDDTGSKNITQQTIDVKFDQTVTPQANVLDKYYNYTYNAELWLLTPQNYKDFVANGILSKQQTLGAGMLMRSGGIRNTGSIQVKIGDQEAVVSDRNPYFSLDYYIDTIEFSNYLPGKGSGAAHNVTNIKMTVIEPNGITLIDNLIAAVQSYLGVQNYTSAVYLLKISFYGYDENGELQKVNNNNVNTASDPYAVVTKYIPFLLNDVTFAVTNSLVTYTLTGTPTGQSVGTGQARGTIPYNIEVSGSTVGQVLGNDLGATTTSAQTPTDEQLGQQFQANTNRSILNTLQTTGGVSSNSAPPKADAAANLNAGTIVGGLMGALNEFQRGLVKKKVFDIADEYSIEFTDEIMRGAKVRKALNSAYSNTPMSNNANPRSIASETQAMNPNQRIVGITAGMPIVQAIDLVMRNSEYIEKQQLAQVDESSGDTKDNPRRAKSLAWFKINLVTEQKGFDFKRNDYAYKIKFVISPFEIKGMDSPWFPTGNFSGVHKSYPYWFTGQNTAVLEYQQTYNHAYRTTLSGANKNNQLGTSDLQKIRKYWYAPRSAQSSQQGDAGVNEPAANAADYLYSVSDLGTVKIRIVGDPAWIVQGEVFGGVDARRFNFAPFLPDGTINFDAGEVLFEIVWVRNGDYDIETGQMKPDLQSKSNNRTSRQSLVYKAVSCASYFNQGKFEQQLDGNLYIFPIPNTTQQAKTNVQDTKDLEQTKSDVTNTILRNPVSGITTSSPAAAATDALSNPSNNNTSGAIGTDRFAGQASTDAAIGANHLGVQTSAPAVLPQAPAEPPSSSGQIDSPQPGLAGVQTNIVIGQDQTGSPVPATFPGVQINIVPTQNRQLMNKET